MSTSKYLAVALLALVTAGLSAGEDRLSDLDLGAKGKLTHIQGKVEQDTVGRFDKLVLVPADSTDPEQDGTIVFETEGRRLIAWEARDMDGDQSPEVLLTLDPSGSGGFVDFFVLSASGTTFAPIWEDTLQVGQASFADRDGDGKPEIVLSCVEQELDRKDPASKTAVLKLQDGRIEVVEGRLHSDVEPAGVEPALAPGEDADTTEPALPPDEDADAAEPNPPPTEEE